MHDGRLVARVDEAAIEGDRPSVVEADVELPGLAPDARDGAAVAVRDPEARVVPLADHAITDRELAPIEQQPLVPEAGPPRRAAPGRAR